MIIVMYSSKDWSFNQILAHLWSFLSISAFVSINFCNFAVKQQKSIMAKPFLIVPIIGAMFADLINTGMITLFLNLL